jgi:chorismate--pyruvate lyase
MKNIGKFVEQKRLINKIPPKLRDWILHKKSFMDRLRQKGLVDLSIQLLQQSWQSPDAEESHLLSIERLANVWVREVLIVSDQKQWMFARTVIPQNTLKDQELCLMNLGDRSLGSVLFNDPSMWRSEFELAYFTSELDWHKKIVSYTNKILPALWARRSIFMIKEKPLLLTEVFLPDTAML